jgi:outer membrane receptor protein involved in Fe transport
MMFCTLPVVTSSLIAQDTTIDNTNEEEDVYVLSPFDVVTSEDTGYLATNSNTGTRLNMQIKDVPLNLEVITNEFITDTGATNLRDTLRYSAGMVLSSQSDAFANIDSDPQSAGANDPRGATRSAGDSTTKLRGFIGSSMLQDGFKRVYAADTANIERVEVLRGPSALLYGTGNFGGVVNYITKAPNFDMENYHIGLMAGSHNLLRVEGDANIPLVDSNSNLAKYEPALRLTGAWEQSGDYTEYYNQEHWQINGVLSFQPFKNTKVKVSAEFGHKREDGVGFQNIRNSFGGTAASRNVLWLTDEYDSETGQKIGETENDRTFRWSGEDPYMKGPYRNLVVDIEQKITDDLYLKIGYSNSKTTFDSRQINAWITTGGGLTSGSGYESKWTGESIPDRTDSLWSYLETIDFSRLEASEGMESTDNAVIQYEWVDDNKVTDRDQIRAELAYKKDLGNWGKHSVVLGFQYDKTDLTDDIFRPAQTYVMSYEDADGIVRNGETYTVNNYDRYSYKNINDHSVFTYGTQGDGYDDNPQVHWTSQSSQTWDAGYYAMYQGQFFNDRLTIVGGARYDRIDARDVTTYVYANELYDSGETSMGKANRYSGRTGSDAITNTSPQIGLSYNITDNISVFGVYSTGIVPNFSAHDGNDEMLDPSDVKNFEAGIKFDFFDGKLSGTISGFKIERKNVAKYVWWAPNPANSVADGYNPDKGTSYTLKYATPAAFYTGIYLSGMDHDTAVATAKSICGEAWWGLIDEVANIQNMDGIDPASLTQTTGNEFFDNVAPDLNLPISNNFWNCYSPGDPSNPYAYEEDGTTLARDNFGNLIPNGGATTLAQIQSGIFPMPALYYCETGHDNSRLNDTVWYSIVDYGVDSDVDQFMDSILNANGWMGNFGQAINGQTYKYGDGSVGTANGATGHGAYVPMEDESTGFDIQLNWSPIPEIQIVAAFSHLEREITSKTYKLVSAKFAPGAEWLKSDYAAGTLDPNLVVTDVYDDLNDSSTYHAVIPDTGESGDDSPENTFSLWARYELSHASDWLDGWAIGSGVTWEDERCWYSGFQGDGNVTYVGSTKTLVQYWTDPRYTVNFMLEYKTTLFDDYNARFAVNVDNILNDKDLYGLVYAPGRSVKFSFSLDF